MNIETKLKKDYPTLIRQKTLMRPYGFEKHEIIKFNLLLDELFPGTGKFISQDLVNKLLRQIDEKYNNGIPNSDQSYFKSDGTLKIISINELKFFQEDIFISGPEHSQLDEPVYVIKHNGQLILRNGYHRTLIKILTQDNSISAYILEVN